MIIELDELFDRGSLARLLGVSERTVYAWSRDIKQPRPARLAALRRLVDMIPEIRGAARSRLPILIA